ncbi:MAG: LamG domain-containing protein [Lentisphaeria bacterium]|nr:LamG domain-containing protein [Lentisphaeria bacterium]
MSENEENKEVSAEPEAEETQLSPEELANQAVEKVKSGIEKDATTESKINVQAELEKDFDGPDQTFKGVDFEQDGNKEIPDDFKEPEEEKKKFFSKSNLPVLLGGGAGLIIVLGLVAYVATAMFGGNTTDKVDQEKLKVQLEKEKIYEFPADVIGTYPHEWAWLIDKNINHVVYHPELLKGAVDGFTFEFWVKVENGKGLENITISNPENLEQFNLTIQREKSNKHRASFMISQASKSKTSGYMPKDGKWTHVAATYNIPRERIYIHINGKVQKSKSLKILPRLSVGGFRIKVSMNAKKDEEETNIALDEIRFTKKPLYGAASFSPHRVLNVLPKTSSLIHLEQRSKKVVYDEARENLLIEFPVGTAWEKVEISEVNKKKEKLNIFYQEQRAAYSKISKLKKLSPELEAEKARIRKLLSAWKKASPEQRDKLQQDFIAPPVPETEQKPEEGEQKPKEKKE